MKIYYLFSRIRSLKFLKLDYSGLEFWCVLLEAQIHIAVSLKHLDEIRHV